MGLIIESSTRFVCDQCQKTAAVEGPAPNPPGNWKRVTPAEPDGDLFCSWTCLVAYGQAQLEVPR